MKSLIAIASLFVAFSANARQVQVLGSVHFQAASTWVPAQNVCRDGNVLRHTQKDFTTVDVCETSSNTNCDVVYRSLVQPVVSTVQRCKSYTGRDNSTCKAYETVAFNQSTVRTTVYSSKNNAQEQRGGTPGPRYTIPACR